MTKNRPFKNILIIGTAIFFLACLLFGWFVSLSIRAIEPDFIQLQLKIAWKDVFVVTVAFLGIWYWLIQKNNGGFLRDIVQKDTNSDILTNKYAFIVNSSKELMTLISKDTVYEVVNDAYCQAQDKTQEELIGKTVTEVWGSKVYETVVKPRLDRCLNGEEVHYYSRFEFADLGLRHMHITYSPCKNKEGEITHATVISHDITDVKMAEEKMRIAKEEAEKVAKLKSQFLANMSHEIRTPMNGIMGMTDILLDMEITTDQKEYLDVIKTSSDALLNIINDILDFSKLDAGKMELSIVDFDLQDTVNSIIKALSFQAAQKNLEFQANFSPDIHHNLIGDPGRLRQILTNLLGNSLKFTSKGKVALTITKDAETEEDIALKFVIADTGIGIPEDKIEQLFKSFSQVDMSRTKKYGGTGLGLAISKQLVELMGGTIWIESTLGIGSMFSFIAHFKKQVEVPKTSSVLPINLQTMNALILDPNVGGATMLGNMLTELELKVTNIPDTNEGIALLEKNIEKGIPFQMVFLDANLPEQQDDFQLVKKIKQTTGNNDLLIFVTTSSGVRGDAARCFELGASAYITKPINKSELAGILKEVITSEKNGQSSGLITKHNIPLEFKKSDPPKIKQKPNNVPLKILLAEDNPSNQKLALAVLKKMGWDIEIAGDGKIAVEKFQSEKFDLILMDVQMPVMDGLEATNHIREIETKQGGHIPIIGLSANAVKGDKEIAVTAGMDEYITKPFNAKKLYALIEEMMV